MFIPVTYYFELKKLRKYIPYMKNQKILLLNFFWNSLHNINKVNTLIDTNYTSKFFKLNYRQKKNKISFYLIHLKSKKRLNNYKPNHKLFTLGHRWVLKKNKKFKGISFYKNLSTQNPHLNIDSKLTTNVNLINNANKLKKEKNEEIYLELENFFKQQLILSTKIMLKKNKLVINFLNKINYKQATQLNRDFIKKFLL